MPSNYCWILFLWIKLLIMYPFLCKQCNHCSAKQKEIYTDFYLLLLSLNYWLGGQGNDLITVILYTFIPGTDYIICAAFITIKKIKWKVSFLDWGRPFFISSESSPKHKEFGSKYWAQKHSVSFFSHSSSPSFSSFSPSFLPPPPPPFFRNSVGVL